MSADFQERMAAGKLSAMRDRERGGSTVRVHTTTQAMLADRAPVELDNFDRWLLAVADRVADIIESSRPVCADLADFIPF